MKIFNRVLCVLVLVAAITSAVFSFMLFEKREQMTKGWNQLSKAIQDTAVILDKESGTGVGKELTVDALGHRQALSALDTKLEKLSSAANKVIQQRNELADLLVKTAKSADYAKGDSTKLKNIKNYAQHGNEIANEVQRIQNTNNTILQQYISVGKALNVNDYDLYKLKKSYSAFNASVTAQINDRNRRIDTFKGRLSRIARTVSVDPHCGKDYAHWSDSVVTGVNNQKAKLVQSQNMVATLRTDKESLEGKILEYQQSENRLKKTIVQKNERIRLLEVKLNPENDKVLAVELYEKKTAEDFAQMYRSIRGHVNYVDLQWGFVLVDIGKYVDIERKIAKRTFCSRLFIPAGETMSVMRNFGSANPKFIGKISLKEVFPDYAVADIKSSAMPIAVGDTVIFQKDDVDKLIKNPNATVTDDANIGYRILNNK